MRELICDVKNYCAWPAKLRYTLWVKKKQDTQKLIDFQNSFTAERSIKFGTNDHYIPHHTLKMLYYSFTSLLHYLVNETAMFQKSHKFLNIVLVFYE